MEKLYISDLGDGNFKNPILFADYSDPDVIRVGDTFYMTASSFNYVPGLPILTSKDLVNWKLVNYALKNIQFDNYDIPQPAKGVWAPAIRHHDGEFFIYYGMPDEGIFMVKTADPLGQWQEPVCVLEGKGLIDSCPFWDEDGKAAKIAAVRAIYDELAVSDEAKAEIARLHAGAMGHVRKLGVSKMRVELLKRYADALVSRSK